MREASLVWIRRIYVMSVIKSKNEVVQLIFNDKTITQANKMHAENLNLIHIVYNRIKCI